MFMMHDSAVLTLAWSRDSELLASGAACFPTHSALISPAGAGRGLGDVYLDAFYLDWYSVRLLGKGKASVVCALSYRVSGRADQGVARQDGAVPA